MMAEWLNKWLAAKKRVTPKDNLCYYVSKSVIEFTEKVLREYGNREPKAEGLVYWAGTIDGEKYFVNAAIAPRTEASRYGILTTHNANARFVDFISDNDLVYIAQVHSHPSTWVDHSDVDNKETAFRSEGLVSVVVPSFSEDGMLPFKRCGIHRYFPDGFKRLTSTYVLKHFKLLAKPSKVILKDLRYE
jgi:hypothetical protein